MSRGTPDVQNLEPDVGMAADSECGYIPETGYSITTKRRVAEKSPEVILQK
jgi:hypothetical protein